ncbi:hypothetical protein BaRGS_00029594 [Batillaria attramentaria]|uniref:Uncharacterized protein n=1 Tax=Batillaria attramentaria TaxID=370345 RepID=A0ABD0JWC6_9CAEN
MACDKGTSYQTISPNSPSVSKGAIPFVTSFLTPWQSPPEDLLAVIISLYRFEQKSDKGGNPGSLDNRPLSRAPMRTNVFRKTMGRKSPPQEFPRKTDAPVGSF